MKSEVRNPIRKLTCPQCWKPGVIVRILWGMPEEDFDYIHYESGGCIREGHGFDPDLACKECDWRGYRNELDSLISKEVFNMSQGELLDDEGEVINYWDVTEKGIHFEIETYADPRSDLSLDMEVQFTVLESEFEKIYQFFNIELSMDIREAIQEISDSGRGMKLRDMLGTTIAVVDKFVWMN